VRRHLAQLIQPCLPGAKIVVGEAHADLLELRGQILHPLDLHHRGLVHLDHKVQRCGVGAQLHQLGEKTRVEGFARVRVDEQGRTAVAAGDGADAVVAEGLTQLGLTPQPGGHAKEMHGRLGQRRVPSATQPLEGDRCSGVHVDNGLQRAADALPTQQLLELALLRDEEVAQALAGGHQDRALVAVADAQQEGRRFGAALTHTVLGAREVDDVVVGQQHRTLHAFTVDESAVGAVQVGQPQAAGDVEIEFGVATTHPHRRVAQVAARVAADTKRQRIDLPHGTRAITA